MEIIISLLIVTAATAIAVLKGFTNGASRSTQKH